MLTTPIILATWLLIGPPLPIYIAIAILIVVMTVLHEFSLTRKSSVLLGLMGLMVLESVVFVLMVHFQLWLWGPHTDIGRNATWLGQLLFGLDFRLAEVGVVAALCIGAYIEFVRSRFNLSQAFPNTTFYSPTEDIVSITRKLATAANIDCPKICLVDNGAPCAFTTRSRGEYTIAVSVGLVESLDPKEVEACLAHEIAHIRNRDFALRTCVTMVRVALFAKLLSYFVEAAFYRTRELLADRTAADLIDGTEYLISALTKLRDASIEDGPIPQNSICFFKPEKDVINC